MILLDVHDWFCERLRIWGVECTADQRDIQAPGSFVTVTRLSDWSLDLTTAVAHGELILMTRDLGGREDIAAKDELLARVLENLAFAGVVVTTIKTAEQASPPDSAPLPAITLEWSLAWTID